MQLSVVAVSFPQSSAVMISTLFCQTCLSIGYVLLFDYINAAQGQQPSNMVKVFDQVLHEQVMAGNK